MNGINFLKILSVILIVFASLIGACSSENKTEKKTQNSNRLKEPFTVNAFYTHKELKSLLKTVYQQEKKNLDSIQEISFEEVTDKSISDNCKQLPYFILMERSFSDKEKSKCKSYGSKPVDFYLTTLRNSGDTVFMYANESILANKDVNNLLTSVFNSTKSLSDINRYNSADTGMVNRNKGLLYLHS